ncbi:tyrosine-type recombinase/integrase [Xanthobacter autotrophicus]|uniref:tyrosine-type recombinase/integrase n=1 Tax=Xanthobacter autotrophicus TaxID=280 RepID=UPI00372C35B1
MRQNLPGLASATKTLADGTKRTYFYAWRGGPMLKGADGAPLRPDQPEFIVAYAEAHKARKKVATGTFFNLVAEYRASSEFQRRADKTRRDYARYLKLIEDKFGTLPIAAVEHVKARGNFKAWRDGMSATPRAADYAWTVLARVLAVAKDNGRIAVNVCERGGRLYAADRAEIVWTEEAISDFMAVASEPLRQALVLALWTGQRQGDLLRLSWSAYDGERISLRQAKTRARVVVPTGAPLRRMLDAMKERRGPAITILTNSRGEPWTQDGFRTSWGKAAAKAGLGDLHFHDLRGTAVTRLALAGCTVPQIAAITGHSQKDAESILGANYLGGTRELAEQAAAKLEEKYGG